MYRSFLGGKNENNGSKDFYLGREAGSFLNAQPDLIGLLLEVRNPLVEH